MISFASEIPSSVRKSYLLLRKNDPLILSSSTAFFATFSLSPILIIIIDLLKPLMGRETVHRELFSKIQRTLGFTTARDVKTIVDGFESLESNIWFTILSTLFFYFIATTLLGVIKQNIHQLWRLKRKEGIQTIYFIKERLTGIALMMLFAILMVISYTMDIVEKTLPDHELVINAVDIIFSLLIITTWFTLLFKYLPEARVPWLIAIIGGLFTGMFFNVGVFLLTKILIHKKVALIFGVSSSMAMLLLFIFYCSFILYLGVAFMYELSKAIKKPIRPGKYATEFREQITLEGK